MGYFRRLRLTLIIGGMEQMGHAGHVYKMVLFLSCILKHRECNISSLLESAVCIAFFLVHRCFVSPSTLLLNDVCELTG